MRFDPSLPDDRVNIPERSALGEALLMVIGLLVFAAIFAGGLAFAIEALIPILPVSAETRIFGGLWSGLSEGSESEEDPELEALVDRLTRHWPDSGYRFHVGVVEAEQANAFALPGGTIMVTSGLLESVTSENELAFVLGHEFGHYHNRDHLRGIGRGVAWVLVLSVVGLGDSAAGALVSTAGSLAQRSFDRDQEHEADLFGLGILGQEYGHAGGAVEVFQTLLIPPDDGDEDEAQNEEITRYFDSHPANPERIDHLRSAAALRGLPMDGIHAPWPAPLVEGAPAPDAPEGADQSGR